MNETLERRCEFLVENQRAMCKSFMLEHSLTNAVVAAAFAEREMKLDVDHDNYSRCFIFTLRRDNEIRRVFI